jgi:hypothetical protein
MGAADAAPSHFLYPHSTSVSTLIEIVQGYNHSFVNRRYGNERPLVRWPECLEAATLGFRRGTQTSGWSTAGNFHLKMDTRWRDRRRLPN